MTASTPVRAAGGDTWLSQHRTQLLLTPSVPLSTSLPILAQLPVTKGDDIRINAPVTDYGGREYGYGHGAPNIGEVFGPINGTTYNATAGGQGQMYQVQFASIAAAAASSPVQVVAAVSGKLIYVLSFNVGSSGAAGSFQWQDNSGSPVNFTGPMSLAQNATFSSPSYPWGQFQTTVTNKALMLAVVGSSCVMNGYVAYILY